MVAWIAIDDPESFVRIRLAEEADDIPDDLIDARPWTVTDMARSDLRVDLAMVADHDADPIHCARRDGFIEAIRAGDPIPPLIALGADRFLVDGYARYRALTQLGIERVAVLCQHGS